MLKCSQCRCKYEDKRNVYKIPFSRHKPYRFNVEISLQGLTMTMLGPFKLCQTLIKMKFCCVKKVVRMVHYLKKEIVLCICLVLSKDCPKTIEYTYSL